MRTTFLQNIKAINRPEILRRKSNKATVISYNSLTKTATIRILGSTSISLSNIPVSLGITSVIAANQTAIVVYTEENNPQSAIVVAVY